MKSLDKAKSSVASQQDTHSMIAMLAGLAQETRLRIFRELISHHATGDDEGGLAAGALSAVLGIPAPTLSFHLKEMSRASLVTSRKIGRSVIYKANLSAMEALLGYLMEDCCGGRCSLSTAC